MYGEYAFSADSYEHGLLIWWSNADCIAISLSFALSGRLGTPAYLRYKRISSQWMHVSSNSRISIFLEAYPQCSIPTGLCSQISSLLEFCGFSVSKLLRQFWSWSLFLSRLLHANFLTVEQCIIAHSPIWFIALRILPIVWVLWRLRVGGYTNALCCTKSTNSREGWLACTRRGR